MSREVEMLGFLGVLWLLAVSACVAARVASRRDPIRRFWLGTVLAGVATAIGVVGIWTPFSFWPQIFYPVSLGEFRFSLDFRWFFALPLGFGVLTAARVLGNRCRRSTRTEEAADSSEAGLGSQSIAPRPSAEPAIKG